jgi:capsular polysaccharide biosynthesis protein
LSNLLVCQIGYAKRHDAMKTYADLNLDPESDPQTDPPGTFGLTRLPARPHATFSFRKSPPLNESLSPSPAPRIDPWLIAEAIVKRWYWLGLGAVALGIVGVMAGSALWKTTYTATVQVIHRDSPAVAEVLRDRDTSAQTFADLLRTPELITRVSSAEDPPISPDALSAGLAITPERNKESLTISVTGSSPESAADLANLYAREAVRYTKGLQAKEAGSFNEHLQLQLAEIESQMRQLDEQVRQPTRQSAQVEQQRGVAERLHQPALEVLDPSEAGTPVDTLSSITRAMVVDQLRTAQAELGNLLSQFTEASPLVKAQRMKLARLEVQLEDTIAASPTAASTNKPLEKHAEPVPVGPDRRPPEAGSVSAINPPPGRVATRPADLDVARSRLAVLEAARLPLASRQRIIQDLVDNPPGPLQVLVPARPQIVVRHGREIKVAVLSAFAAIMGIVAAGALVLLLEATERRLKTDDDLRRVTHLPVIASLGNLRKMSQQARERWAFRTWTVLQRKLASRSGRGLVCGIISSSDGEGRSTLIHLLAQAASQRGYRVLTVSTCPAGSTNGSFTNVSPNELDTARGGSTVTANVLISPGDVAHRLIGANPQVVVHISLPDWSWNMERRKQLETALDHWRAIDNVVILVNLPPASEPQTTLLAEEMTNLVWLADSGRADAAATRIQVETLRHGRCRFVGAILNHAPSHPLKSLFPRWVAA